MATPQLAWLGSRFRTGGHTKLTLTDSNRTITNEEAYAHGLKFEGTLTANRTITFPACPGFGWKIHNATTGGYSLTIVGPAANSVVVKAGQALDVYYDPDTGFKLMSSSGATDYGAYASRPTAGNTGRLFTCSDSPIIQWVDDGTEWRPLCNGVGKQVIAVSNFAWMNQAAGFTAGDVAGTIKLLGDGSSTEIAGLSASIADGASFVVTLKMRVHHNFESSVGAGLFLREAAGDKFTAFTVKHTYNLAYKTIQVVHYTNPSTISTTPATINIIDVNLDPWLRITVASGTAVYAISVDGVTWTTLLSEPANAFLTIAKAGFCAHEAADGLGCNFTVLSWELT